MTSEGCDWLIEMLIQDQPKRVNPGSHPTWQNHGDREVVLSKDPVLSVPSLY